MDSTICLTPIKFIKTYEKNDTTNRFSTCENYTITWILFSSRFSGNLFKFLAAQLTYNFPLGRFVVSQTDRCCVAGALVGNAFMMDLGLLGIASSLARIELNIIPGMKFIKLSGLLIFARKCINSCTHLKRSSNFMTFGV